jgi:hypothetical protein
MTTVTYARMDPFAGTQRALLTVVAFGATTVLPVCACANTASLLPLRSAAKRRMLR